MCASELQGLFEELEHDETVPATRPRGTCRVHGEHGTRASLLDDFFLAVVGEDINSATKPGVRELRTFIAKECSSDNKLTPSKVEACNVFFDEVTAQFRACQAWYEAVGGLHAAAEKVKRIIDTALGEPTKVQRILLREDFSVNWDRREVGSAGQEDEEANSGEEGEGTAHEFDCSVPAAEMIKCLQATQTTLAAALKLREAPERPAPELEPDSVAKEAKSWQRQARRGAGGAQPEREPMLPDHDEAELAARASREAAVLAELKKLAHGRR